MCAYGAVPRTTARAHGGTGSPRQVVSGQRHQFTGDWPLARRYWTAFGHQPEKTRAGARRLVRRPDEDVWVSARGSVTTRPTTRPTARRVPGRDRNRLADDGPA